MQSTTNNSDTEVCKGYSTILAECETRDWTDLRTGWWQGGAPGPKAHKKHGGVAEGSLRGEQSST